MLKRTEDKVAKKSKDDEPAPHLEPEPVLAGDTPRDGRQSKSMALFAKAVLPVLMIGAGYFGYLHLKSTKPEIPHQPKREKVWPVRAVDVKISDYRPQLRLYGETLAGRRVELRALVGGQVLKIGENMAEGASVSKGEILLTVDSFEYVGGVTQATAQQAEVKAKLEETVATLQLERQALVRAKEQLEIGERDLARAMKLVERRTMSTQTTDTRRLVVSERRARVETHLNNIMVQKARQNQRRAELARYAWGVANARRNLKDTSLRAPFDAYVSSVNADVGRLLNVNDRVATLLDRDWIEVRFTLSDTQYGRIITQEGTVIGRKVDVRWHVGDTPLVYKATIRRVGAEIAKDRGGVEVYARIHNPHKPSPIRAGAFVEILVPDQSYAQVARLPQSALYGQSHVFVIGKKNRLEQRDVELLGVDGDHILVKGALAPGERVIRTRLSTAGKGLKVKEIKDRG